MRKFRVFAIILATALVAGVTIFYACTKDKEETVMNFTEIDKVSSDIADFHTYAMTKFLKEVCSNEDVVNQNTIDKLNHFIEKEVLNYDFKYLKFDASTGHLSNIYDYEMYQKICSTVAKGYDFSTFSSIKNTSTSKATAMLMPATTTTFTMATVNNVVVAPIYSLIERKCQNIENKMSSLVTTYNDFGQLKTAYLKYVTEELKDVTTTNDYTYLRCYADVYISSFEYWVNYYGTKGWLKDTWNKVKEGVAVDAGGAVAGAIYGAYAGAVAGGVGAAPGAAAGAASGAVVGACATSAGWAVTKVISGT